MSEKGSIEYAGRTISFTINRTHRGRLSISVDPELQVQVAAPQQRTLEEIETRVRRRGAWIVRQLEDFERYLPKQPPRRYVSGETHRYLGRQYRLKVEAAEEELGAKLKGRYLHVRTVQPDHTEEVRAQVESWYRKRAHEVFERLVNQLSERYTRQGLSCNGMRLQRMKKRWGSYTARGIILLNPELIKAPTACIEYVIIHELCHARFSHHGKEFEGLLTRCLPDWRERKAHLEMAMATI